MSGWRIGRSLGRTIYLQDGDEPSKDDHFLGIMETPELAQVVVDAVNSVPDIPEQIDDQTLVQELSTVLNRYSVENDSNTPDYILAKYVLDALAAYDAAVKDRDEWYGIHPEPGWGGVAMPSGSLRDAPSGPIA